MEDIRMYNIDLDDTIRDFRDDAGTEREAVTEDELPFEIPRD
jgi:hypothetical protein